MRLAVIIACCCVCALAVLVGRCMDEGDREMPAPPPLRDPMDDAAWDEWVAVWPADTPLEVMEQAVFDRLFAEIPEVAADLRDHA